MGFCTSEPSLGRSLLPDCTCLQKESQKIILFGGRELPHPILRGQDLPAQLQVYGFAGFCPILDGQNSFFLSQRVQVAPVPEGQGSGEASEGLGEGMGMGELGGSREPGTERKAGDR